LELSAIRSFSSQVSALAKVVIFIVASVFAFIFAYFLRRRYAERMQKSGLHIPKRVSFVAAIIVWLPLVLMFGLALFIPQFSFEIVILGSVLYVIFLRWTRSEGARGLLSGWSWLYEETDD